MDQLSERAPLLHIESYKQACEDHRFYADMRFKQLTLFSAISGLLLSSLASSSPTITKPTLSIIGIAATTVLWLMEVRSSIYAQAARARQRLLERAVTITPPQLGHDNFELHWTLLNATNAVLALYIATFVFWFAVFYRFTSTSLRWEGCSALFLIFAVLITFSLREYALLLSHGAKKWKW
jgi:hypothetical protein